MEKNLYAKLELDSANNAINNDQESTIKKINELSQIRMNLFKNLSNNYENIQSSVANSRVNLVDQLTAVGIVENELNNAKLQLNQLKSIKNNKMRMVEINTYYGKRYRAHSQAIKKLILICIPLLVLAILKKKGLLPSFVPDSVVYFVAVLIIIFGGVSFLKTILDIYSRDNMNYDEYDWYFNPKTAKSSDYNYNLPKIDDSVVDDLMCSMSSGCVNSSCCSDGMTFDTKQKKCIENTHKETFMTGQLNKRSFIEATDVVYMGANGNIQPYSEGIPFASVAF
jgi:hypothetical protein